MDYALNLKAYLQKMPLTKMSGQEKFLAVAAHLACGDANRSVSTTDIQKSWKKSMLKIKYSPTFYHRAEAEGWVDPISQGQLHVTTNGIEHLNALVPSSSAGDVKKTGQLMIVNRRATHSFDKFLRSELASAKNQVLIADTYVNDAIFDTVLDVVPKTVPLKLVYCSAQGAFDNRSTRFRQEYQRYEARKHNHFHDRFLVVDDRAFVLGPSIKDAASNAAALVVQLGSKEKALLQSFFNELWATAK